MKSFLNGTLNYNPDTMCSHHSQEHGEGHDCHGGGVGVGGSALTARAALTGGAKKRYKSQNDGHRDVSHCELMCKIAVL